MTSINRMAFLVIIALTILPALRGMSAPAGVEELITDDGTVETAINAIFEKLLMTNAPVLERRI